MRPAELPPCDLVMKGGVTSGIVYPGAVAELAKRYRFANLGGTSAGAVAAAVAAACEYARQGGESIELKGILDVAQDARRPGFFLDLFQPTPSAQPLLSLVYALAGARGSHRRQVIALARAAVRRRPVQAIGTLAAAAVLLALGALAVSRLPIGLALVLAVVAALVVALLTAGAVLGPLVAIVRGAWRSLPGAGFGVCSGLASPGAPDALTDWLHASVQRCAGLPPGQPLTFAMLQARGIALRMVATDLGLARPVTMPFAEEQYLFSPAELSALFPAPVVDHVLAVAGVGPQDRHSTRTWFLPGAQLPVVIGVRLSASVPVLLSSLRLYTADADADGPIESYMTDGGLTSNFPIHFFDDWLPSHPTFGLDLVGVPAVGEEPVFMPAGDEVGHRLAPRPVTGLGGFVGRVQDAARSWRDEAQAELPGYRDRVCQIRMGPGEGGFHLDANPDQVGVLMDRGREAGREILRSFDWERHRVTRYLTLMALLRENFGLLAERLSGAPPPVAPDPDAGAWAAAVDAAVAELARHAGPPAAGQPGGVPPAGRAAMSIGPRL
ncbi:MAG TPA: patatin-like phospholipase family protein [Solirubrobacteraceae bacterium]|nr:patatin-like phospholipase family protein [Solirubrobacteraceae bacterium]